MSSISADARRRRPLPLSLRAIARSALVLIAAWRQNSRDQRQLAAMSERELQDIGVCRGEVADRIGRSFWREPAISSFRGHAPAPAPERR